MPRSSRGVFHAVRSPCDWVKTPPRGGPTSWPKTSVTPWRSSPSCSASRIAWTKVAIRSRPRGSGFVVRGAAGTSRDPFVLAFVLAVGSLGALARQVPLGEDVLPDRLPFGLRLLANALARIEELLGVLRSQLVHRGPRQDLALLQSLLEPDEAVDLLRDEVRARSR